MSYTDKYFKIKIRLTDEFELMRVQEELEKNKDLPETAPSIRTVDSFYFLDDYKKIISFQEMYPPEQEFTEIGAKGFPCTLLYIQHNEKRTESHLCSWSIGEFRKRLDAHVDKISA